MGRKKYLSGLFIVFMLVCTINVKAETISENFKQIFNNDNVITLTNDGFDEKSTLITSYLDEFNSNNSENEYYFYTDINECTDNYTKCNIQKINRDTNDLEEEHIVTINYNEVYSDEYNKFANNGVLTISWTREGSDSEVITNYLSSLNNENYYFMTQNCNDNYSECIGILHNYQTNKEEKHTIAIKYEEKYSDKYQKLTKDGNITITSSTIEDKKNLIYNYVNVVKTLGLPKNFNFNVFGCNEDTTKCEIVLYKDSYKIVERHTVNIKYEEKYSDKFQKITKDGNIVINSSGDKRNIINEYFSAFNTNDTAYSASNCNEDVTICMISMSENINNIHILTEQHVVKISYDEKYSDEFKKITTDGNLVIDAISSNDFDLEFLLTAKLNDLIDTSKYIGYGYCSEDNVCIATIESIDGKVESHEIKVTTKEPSKEIQNIVNDAIKNMKKLDLNQDPFDLKQGYILDDLYLINYYNSIQNVNDWNYYAASNSIKFSKEFIELTKGSNISLKIDLRAGDAINLWDFAFGKAIVYYDGTAYATVDAAITQIHKLYIPKDTENTKEAYIEAAQSRIDNYYGKNDIKVTYGGLLSELDEYNKEYGLIDYSKTDGNYYNIKIGKESYSFVIIKEEQDKLENPTYIGSDIISNISVSSEEAEIPLDTLISVKRIQNENIKKTFNTDNYLSYDIKLFSNTKEANITKLTNGKFKVSIPISEELNGKELTTYYINDNNELIEYVTTVENGYATFETDHFSIYTLVEKQNNNQVIEPNPETYDNIMMWITLSLVSISGILGTIIYKKKQNS